MRKSLQFGLYLLIAAIFVGIDQYTKLWFDTHFDYRQVKPIFSGLNLTLVYNQGAAFGFLNNASGWQQWLFSGLAVLVSMLICVWLYREAGKSKLLSLGLSGILAGAIGNLIDRSLYGHVIDFIDVYVNSWHWPTFNMADVFICVGALLLIVFELNQKKDK